MANGIVFHSARPVNPQIGDVYMDQNTYYAWIWTGCGWNPFSEKYAEEEPEFTPPTAEQLQKHPALKAAWDEFIVLKKLIGV